MCDIGRYDAVFICVGPRHYLSCAQLLGDARVVFVLENDRDATKRLHEVAGSGRFRFGIPDAIVSNTATATLLRRDPLCLIAEPGELILEAGADNPDLGEAVVWVDKVDQEKHWACKFFIHNTSHAIVGYLGALAGHTFIHEALSDPRIGLVVERALQVMTEAVVAEGLVEERLATAYMARELARFGNPLLFDPISRVTRDPLRKLNCDDRLIRALSLVVRSKMDAFPIMLGINAALVHVVSANDEVRSLKSNWSRSYDKILRNVCGLSDEKLIREILSISANEHLRPA
jgi:mannitol-1-phosphate/altronate dehydrogenase